MAKSTSVCEMKSTVPKDNWTKTNFTDLTSQSSMLFENWAHQGRPPIPICRTITPKRFLCEPPQVLSTLVLPRPFSQTTLGKQHKKGKLQGWQVEQDTEQRRKRPYHILLRLLWPRKSLPHEEKPPSICKSYHKRGTMWPGLLYSFPNKTDNGYWIESKFLDFRGVIKV